MRKKNHAFPRWSINHHHCIKATTTLLVVLLKCSMLSGFINRSCALTRGITCIPIQLLSWMAKEFWHFAWWAATCILCFETCRDEVPCGTGFVSIQNYAKVRITGYRENDLSNVLLSYRHIAIHIFIGTFEHYYWLREPVLRLFPCVKQVIFLDNN